MKKLIFYYTHRESLGHTTRSISLVSALDKLYGDKLKIYVFQAGRPQRFCKFPERVKVFDLPDPFYSKFDFKLYKSSSVSFNSRKRAQFMLDRINEIGPDIFVTEFFPFGRYESRLELLPVLTQLKKRGVEILASIGYHYIASGNFKALNFFSSFYDRIFIHVPDDEEYGYYLRNMENRVFKVLYRRFFKVNESKIAYTGYVLPYTLGNLKSERQIRSRFDAEGKRLVLISRGGGVVCPKIIALCALSRKYLDDRYRFVVIPGPASSNKEMALFRQVIRETGGNIFLAKYSPDLSSIMNACDVSVSMAGYNTSMQLLYLRKKAVVIPSLVNPELGRGYCDEQVIRGMTLKKYLDASILDYNTLSAKDIARNIEAMGKRDIRLKHIPSVRFKGAENTAHLIMGAKPSR
ncbi:MAG: glycosyltransferase [Candidatus Omnitrophica bacterium]|nr:glycosyltransferase [Candidatus Omnitrophota bacterium]